VLGAALPLLSPTPAPTVDGCPREREPHPASWSELSLVAQQASAVTPLAPARYKVQFTATATLRDKLARLQALLRQDLATALEAAVTEKLERLETKRFGLTKTPRRTSNATDTSPRSRHLPAAVRRSVRQRDGDQCTFLLRDGSRCPERRGLEFHHRHPYGRGGAHDPENVCLMCRQHNAYVAELDYGKERMEQYRRRADRVLESAVLPMFLQGGHDDHHHYRL
jgi:5-methylcytosine-specific restriction endonuclease McrA